MLEHLKYFLDNRKKNLADQPLPTRSLSYLPRFAAFGSSFCLTLAAQRYWCVATAKLRPGTLYGL